MLPSCTVTRIQPSYHEGTWGPQITSDIGLGSTFRCGPHIAFTPVYTSKCIVGRVKYKRLRETKESVPYAVYAVQCESSK